MLLTFVRTRRVPSHSKFGSVIAVASKLLSLRSDVGAIMIGKFQGVGRVRMQRFQLGSIDLNLLKVIYALVVKGNMTSCWPVYRSFPACDEPCAETRARHNR